MLIANGFQYLMSGRYWISVYPGVALIILIVGINLVGTRSATSSIRGSSGDRRRAPALRRPGAGTAP